MSLSQKYTHSFPFPNPNPSKLPPNPKPFEETLIRRLTSLLRSLPRSSPSVRISFLILAVDLLSSTLSDFALLLSDPNISRSESDLAALSSHLDASAALLDSVNSLTAVIDRLSRLRLHLAFALQLLSHKPLTAELTRKACDSIAEWRENLPKSPIHCPAAGLISGGTPRGKISAVQRAIYAVEAVSALVIGSASSFVGARADIGKIHVSDEFSWSVAFNGVLTAVNGKIGSFASEIEAVDAIVKDLTAAIDGGERLRSVTEEAERRTEELTEGLDRLGNAVNGLFRAALCARNVALPGFRTGPKKYQ